MSLEDAICAVQKIVTKTSNAAVYQKEFDTMNQHDYEPIREDVTRLKACSIDCNFVCPYDENHDLTDYHIINRLRSGVFDKTMQQEILGKSDTLTNLTSLIQFCETFASAKYDRSKLNPSNAVVSLSVIETDGLSKRRTCCSNQLI